MAATTSSPLFRLPRSAMTSLNPTCGIPNSSNPSTVPRKRNSPASESIPPGMWPISPVNETMAEEPRDRSRAVVPLRRLDGEGERIPRVRRPIRDGAAAGTVDLPCDQTGSVVDERHLQVAVGVDEDVDATCVAQETALEAVV